MLLGRKGELEEVRVLLRDAREGEGRALLISGEAGIGKTALLIAAGEQADGMRVIEAVGIEAEANLPFAALGEIATPLLDGLAELPKPQAAAIEAALALDLSSPVPADRLAACAGFLGLLKNAARGQPLLILVDDAHWVDSASAECLGYAARRLAGSRVALIAAARPDQEPPLAGRLSDELTLSGLAREDALSLLRRSADDLSPVVAESLLETSAGNPLALLELSSQLDRDQRSGAAPIEFTPALGGALGEAFERRLARLEPQVRASVLVASASSDRRAGPVAGACGELGIGKDALEQAELEGVLSLADDRIVFAHPLLKAVAYESSPPLERRRAHAALAKHADEDPRAWHLAAATVGADDEVAAALEAAAGRATARGAHKVAADALERAANLSEQPSARASRLHAAGLAAAMGGAYERGVALLEPAAEASDQPVMRAGIRHLHALIALNGGLRPPLSNHDALLEEADSILHADPGMAAAIYADAGVSAAVAGNCRLILAAGERATAVLPEEASATLRCHVSAILGMGLALRGRTPEAREALDRAGALLPQIDPLMPVAQSTCFALHSRICTGQHEILRKEAVSLAAASEVADVYGMLPYFRMVAADASYRGGDWEAASRDSAEAVALADEHGQLGPLSIALQISGRIRASHGETAAARTEAARGIALAESVAIGSSLSWAHAGIGFLELGLGRPEQAIDSLTLAEKLGELAGLDDPTMVPWAPDLVEAYARAGADDDARRVCVWLDERAERTEVALPQAVAARCRGLIADQGFEAEFERALELHRESSAPFERARTQLAYGSRLHRARRRVDARERLREALETFEGLGAEPWVKHTRAELRAAGAIKRQAASDPDELSAQELRVAAAVAEGATNKEVAAQLFLSPKTIEFHLSRVYRKLGIHSRTELAAMVAQGELENLP